MANKKAKLLKTQVLTILFICPDQLCLHPPCRSTVTFRQATWIRCLFSSRELIRNCAQQSKSCTCRLLSRSQIGQAHLQAFRELELSNIRRAYVTRDLRDQIGNAIPSGAWGKFTTYGALVMSSLSLSTEGGQSWAPWLLGLEVSVPSLHLSQMQSG